MNAEDGNADYDPTDPAGDPFYPPAVPTRVECLHCKQEYASDLIQWRIERDEDGLHGFWCCPTPGCGGRGFGFDILPIDPDYRDERGGWSGCDGDDEECDEEAFDDEDDAGDGPQGGGVGTLPEEDVPF